MDRSAARYSALALTLATAVAVGSSACDSSPERAAGDSERGEVKAPSTEIDESVAAQLRELGYVSVVQAPDLERRDGVTALDIARAQPGLTHFTNGYGCSAQLIELDGTVVHTWSVEPCFVWGNSVLLPDGDLLVVHRGPTKKRTAAEDTRARELLRLRWDGSEAWRRRLPVHHDVALTPDGLVAMLTYQHRVIPRFHDTVPVREDFLEILNEAGKTIERVSLVELLDTAPPPFSIKPVEPHHGKRWNTTEVDLVHANSLEWMPWPALAERAPLYAPGNVLVCLRDQDSVVIVDWEQRRIVWSWGRGQLSGPHDATWLENGNLLIFDNGLGRKWSRVVELDPLTRKIVWEYRAPEPTDLFTETRGAAQRLANGNTLITASVSGRIFEVTPGGEVVWDFNNPNRNEKGKPIVVIRARRLRASSVDERPFERVD